MNNLLSEFKNHIEENFSFLKGSRLLIACSGGLDSVVLVHLVNSLKLDFALAHCNFQLRGKESDTDEMFVIGLAKRLDVPVFAETFDTKVFAKNERISTQMAARTLRYNWFEEVLSNFKYDYLLTAHHLDDDLETFFINVSRGTGIAGLAGIPVQNGNILRPMLPFLRKEIELYANKNNIKWREDSSNQKSDYLRNKIRLEVLPKFKETNPSIFKNFKTTQRNIQSSRKLIEDYMALIYNLVVTEEKEMYKINIPKLKDIPNINELLYELLNGFGFTEWNDVENLLDAQTGKQLFSKTHKLLKNREELILTTINSEDQEVEFLVYEAGISKPIKLKIEEVDSIGETANNILYIDSDKISFPLKIRKRREGDVFYPFGMRGKKKLSKYFKDEKVPVFEKDKTWILLCEEKLVWVMGYRSDERFKVDSNTSRIYKITYTE